MNFPICCADDDDDDDDGDAVVRRAVVLAPAGFGQFFRVLAGMKTSHLIVAFGLLLSFVIVGLKPKQKLSS